MSKILKIILIFIFLTSCSFNKSSKYWTNKKISKEKNEKKIETFKKDEAISIPDDIDYENFSGLSNEIKSKLKLIRPRTLGQALRIDGVTPAAANLLLAFVKKSRYKVSA